MDCLTCNHAQHEKGKCRQCNCGESSIVRLHGERKITLMRMREDHPFDSSLTRYGYDRGHRVQPKRQLD
jgi:hypothetical protein